MASLRGLSEVAAPAKTGTDWGAILTSAIPAVVQARHQDKVLTENLKRERAGLPPLNVESYQPGVKVGLDPQTRGLILKIGLGVAALIGAGLYFGRGR